MKESVMNAPVLNTKIVRACALALAFTLAWVPGGGVIAAAAPPAETSVEGRARPGPRMAPLPPTPDEVASYARRDKKASPELARFAGGDVIVITTTTLVIILLVVLIIVLI